MNLLSFRTLLPVTGILLCLVFIAALLPGPSDISVPVLLQILLDLVSQSAFPEIFTNYPAWKKTIVYQVRLPRTLLAALVGASLAVSGSVLQGVFQNPLASPGILGVSSGASLGAVLAIFFGFAASTIWALPLLAFIGACLTLLLVYRIASYQGRAPVTALLLSGVAVSSFNVAMVSLLLALAVSQWQLASVILFWTMGSLDGRSWFHVGLLLPVFAISLTIVFLYKRDLDALLVGETHAAAVGIDVHKVRLHLLLVTALLTSTAVAVAGGIGFIGLIVPHITRLMVGPRHEHLLPLSALIGALVLVSADILINGSYWLANIPIGVITAAMGAPFFLFLLIRHRKIMQV